MSTAPNDNYGLGHTDQSLEADMPGGMFPVAPSRREIDLQRLLENHRSDGFDQTERDEAIQWLKIGNCNRKVFQVIATGALELSV